jgi:hypothetical protein
MIDSLLLPLALARCLGERLRAGPVTAASYKE